MSSEKFLTTPDPATHCGTTSASTVPGPAKDGGRRLHNDGSRFNRLVVPLAQEHQLRLLLRLAEKDGTNRPSLDSQSAAASVSTRMVESAARSHVNSRARAIPRRDSFMRSSQSSTMRMTLSAMSWTQKGSINSPASPTTSGNEVDLATIGTVPAAIASRAGSPKRVHKR
jgi:hypothetical protein